MKTPRFSSADLSSGIIVPLLLVVIGASGYFVLLPRYRELKDNREAVRQRQAEVMKHESQLTDIQRLVADLKEKRTSLKVLDEALPTAPRIPELLANFDQLAKQSGLFVSDLNLTTEPAQFMFPAGQSSVELDDFASRLGVSKNLGVMQATVTLKGNYSGLKTFLKAAELNLRLLDAQSVVATSSTEPGESQEFSLLLLIYYFKE